MLLSKIIYLSRSKAHEFIAPKWVGIVGSSLSIIISLYTQQQ